VRAVPGISEEMLSIEEIESAWRRSEPVVLADPVSRRAPLPFQATFYPMGFPVEVTTNSRQVLDGAVRSWASFKRMFDTQPVQMRVAVTRGGSTECPAVPVCRGQHNLLAHIADSENFAMCDLAQGFCFLSLTQAAVEHEEYLRFYFLEATALCQIATRYVTPIHAACVALNGSGILLCGDSGAGKSTLAYACARAGWTYITDDASYLINHRDDLTVVGNCSRARFRPSAAEIFPELQGGEVTQRGETGKPSIELSTPAFRNIVRSHTSKVDYVVFLNRRDVEHPVLGPFSKEIARYFMQQPLFSMPEMMTTQDGMIDRLLSAPVLELRYTDLNWAIGRLSRLVREGE